MENLRCTGTIKQTTYEVNLNCDDLRRWTIGDATGVPPMVWNFSNAPVLLVAPALRGRLLRLGGCGAGPWLIGVQTVDGSVNVAVPVWRYGSGFDVGISAVE